MILIVFLILVECEVLVDVFHVGCSLIRCVVALGAAIAIGRVALRVVDVLVALQDGRFELIPVATTEVVIVVACRVCKDAVEDGLVHLALYLTEVGVLVEFSFLFVVESIEAHVLQCSASLGGGKGVGHGTLIGHFSPLCVAET